MIIIYVLLIILIYPVMYSNFGIYNNKKMLILFADMFL